MDWRIAPCVILFVAAMPSRTDGQTTKAAAGASISYPGKSWAVKIDSPGFSIEDSQRKPDGRAYLLANNPATGLVLSVTLEESPGGADKGTCPDYLKKRVAGLSDLGVKDAKTSQVNSMDVVEYMIPMLQGIPLQQKNFVACTTKEDVYIDIHLSKVQFRASDESLFTDLLNRVQIVDIPASASSAAKVELNTTVMDYFRDGSSRYLQHDYQGALGPYQAALDLEQKQPTLPKNMWRVLVDNLGMAYGITGDLDRSEKTFIYGVNKDPAYPMLYYNLGCVYAERNDMDKTMEYLRKAFALKANAIPGEGMPDPRQDDSFQRFMSDERFQKFVDSLATQSN